MNQWEKRARGKQVTRVMSVFQSSTKNKPGRCKKSLIQAIWSKEPIERESPSLEGFTSGWR